MNNELKMLVSERVTWKGGSENRYHCVLEITDYDDGMVDIEISPNDYIRFRHEDLTAAIMAMRVEKGNE